jgi:hypothetical protein
MYRRQIQTCLARFNSGYKMQTGRKFTRVAPGAIRATGGRRRTAAQNIAPHLAPGAIVVSMQNGADNVTRIRAASGIDALGAAVYVAAEMTARAR